MHHNLWQAKTFQSMTGIEPRTIDIKLHLCKYSNRELICSSHVCLTVQLELMHDNFNLFYYLSAIDRIEEQSTSSEWLDLSCEYELDEIVLNLVWYTSLVYIMHLICKQNENGHNQHSRESLPYICKFTNW